MKVDVFRTKMIGGGHSYDCLVPEGEVPHRALINSRIIRRGRAYITFDEATMPAEHFSMERGLARWEKWKEHERVCDARRLAIIQDVYPETVTLTRWPVLWECFDGFDGPHAVVAVEVAPCSP